MDSSFVRMTGTLSNDELRDSPIHCLEHLDESRLAVEICPIACRILWEYLDFSDSLSEHELHFLYDRLDRARCLTSTDRRYDTEGTIIIASFCDFQVFIAKWCMHIRTDFITSPDECFFILAWSFDRCEIVREGFFFGFFMCLFCIYDGREIELRLLPEYELFYDRVAHKWYYRDEVLKTCKESIVLHAHVASHQYEFLAEWVIVGECLFALLACRREESTGIHDDVLSISTLRIIVELYRCAVRVLQYLADSIFEIDHIFRATEIDSGEGEHRI